MPSRFGVNSKIDRRKKVGVEVYFSIASIDTKIGATNRPSASRKRRPSRAAGGQPAGGLKVGGKRGVVAAVFPRP